MYYPVSLDLRGRRAVVIGGGALAESKVRGLIDAGATVIVVALSATPGLETLGDGGAITLVRRAYRDGDLADAFLAIAALESADERALHAEIFAEAESRHVLLNAVDDVRHCHFIAPAIHRQGDITIAVSTGGASPALAVRIRDGIARRIGREYGRLAELLGALRPKVAEVVPDPARRTRLWQRIVASDVLTRLRRGDERAARKRIDALVDSAARGEHESPRRGFVDLVGAGPGAPGLITVRGLKALRRADVVVYDRLVDPALLRAAPPDALRVDAGKRVGDGGTSQFVINDLLVRLARQGNRVVRLKGGDPFVFGRGGEECEALRAAGVRFRVIPGVSAAIAAPGAIGIPVTHRGLASAVAVVSARGADGYDADVDWRAVARMPSVVVLMGLGSLTTLVCRLLTHGRSPETPAAVIASATLPTQRAVVGTLSTIAEQVERAGLESPATLVVGEVVSLTRVSARVPAIESREVA